MTREQNRNQLTELIIQRKGKTVYARLKEDREFDAAEIAGATMFKARLETVGQAKRELQDLMKAGGFKVVVPASSALAPEQSHVVVFGDMSGGAGRPGRPAQPRPAAPPSAPERGEGQRAKDKGQMLPPATPASERPVRPRIARPKAVAAAPATVSAPAPAPVSPAPAPAAPPRPADAKPAAAPAPRAPRPKINTEERAFKAFYAQWRTRNKIPRLPKEELEELRRGEWQEVREKFIADWVNGRK